METFVKKHLQLEHVKAIRMEHHVGVSQVDGLDMGPCDLVEFPMHVSRLDSGDDRENW
jgi:hypothetical protein